MRDEPLLLQLGERLELRSDAAGLRGVEATHPEVHDVEPLDAEVAEVVVHLLDELVRFAGVRPPALLVTARTDLRHDAQVVRVGVQCLADDLVRHARAVEVRGVDVGDAEFDDGAEDADGLVVVGGRPEDAGSGELHGAVPDAGEFEVVGEAEGPAGEGAFGHATTLRPGDVRGQVPLDHGTTGTRNASPAARSIAG